MTNNRLPHLAARIAVCCIVSAALAACLDDPTGECNVRDYPDLHRLELYVDPDADTGSSGRGGDGRDAYVLLIAETDAGGNTVSEPRACPLLDHGDAFRARIAVGSRYITACIARADKYRAASDECDAPAPAYGDACARYSPLRPLTADNGGSAVIDLRHCGTSLRLRPLSAE